MTRSHPRPQRKDPAETQDNDTVSRRTNMTQVASLAGVAVSSVSRALSGHPDVSARMRKRVLAATSRLGYEPDFLAQSLRRGATLSVGFVCRDISTPLMASFASGAESLLRRRGYSMLLMNSEDDPTLDAQHINFLKSRRVDGLILCLTSEQDPAILDTVARLRVPVVVIDRELPPRLGASAVMSDHRSGTRAAAEHLIRLGHRRVGLISGPLTVLPSRERLAGIRDAMAAHGISEYLTVVEGPFTPAHGEKATVTLLDSQVPPTAIVAGSNQILIGCLRAFVARGLRPGNPISLVSCDETPLSELVQPPISVVARDSSEVGRTAAEFLMRRLSGEGGPSTTVLPTHFVPRGSCAPPE